MSEGSNRFGISLEEGSVVCVAIDPTGKPVEKREMHDIAPSDAVACITDLLNDIKIRNPELGRVGLAVPGLVDDKTGTVAFSASNPLYAEIDLANEIRSASSVDIYLENDANAAAVAEFNYGAGRGSKNIFYTTLGSGVGGAFIFNGSLWHGSSGFAGEFGYLTLNSEGIRLEDVASGANIIRRTRSRFHQDSTSSLNRFSEEEITLKDIIHAAENQDDFAQMMLERTGTYVGTGVAAVINLLNIETVVLGGEIMGAKNLVLDAVIRRARELSFAPAFKTTSIVEAELGYLAPAIGAAVCAGLQ